MAIIAQEMLQEKKRERILAISLCVGLCLLITFLVYHNFENFNLDSGIILILATLYVYMKCYDLYKKPAKLVALHDCSVMGEKFDMEIGGIEGHWNFCPWCSGKIIIEE